MIHALSRIAFWMPVLMFKADVGIAINVFSILVFLALRFGWKAKRPLRVSFLIWGALQACWLGLMWFKFLPGFRLG